MLPTLHPDDILWVRLAPTRLQPGDIALFRRGDELFSHRFLAHRHHNQQRFYLAKGDGHWAFDPLWSEHTFFGVAESVERDGVIHPIAALHPWQRWLHVSVGLLQGGIHRWRHRLFLLVLTLFLLTTTVAEAAVTLISFTATFQGESVLLRWETASEVNALGFNLYRSLPPGGEETLLNPDIIPAQGEITGAVYQFLDENPPTAPDGYQYRLEEIDADGQVESFTPVVLNRATATATATPSATPSATPTVTLAPPAASATPTSTMSFTATPTPTASRTPTLTPAISPTSTATANPATTASPTPAFTATPAASPTPPSTAMPASPTVTTLPTLTPTPVATTPTPMAASPASVTSTISPSPTVTSAAIAAIPMSTLAPLRFPDANTTSSPSTGRNPNLIYGLVGILSLVGAGILVGILLRLRGRWSR